jgi:hypothetical protein
MAEVTAPQAAEIIGKSLMTIHRKVEDGLLPARQEGTGQKKYIYISLDELRAFAVRYGYRLDESLAAQYAK